MADIFGKKGLFSKTSMWLCVKLRVGFMTLLFQEQFFPVAEVQTLLSENNYLWYFFLDFISFVSNSDSPENLELF